MPQIRVIKKGEIKDLQFIKWYLLTRSMYPAETVSKIYVPSRDKVPKPRYNANPKIQT